MPFLSIFIWFQVQKKHSRMPSLAWLGMRQSSSCLACGCEENLFPHILFSQPAIAKPMQLFWICKPSLYFFFFLQRFFPETDKRFCLTFSLSSSHTCRVMTFWWFFDLVHCSRNGHSEQISGFDLYDRYPFRSVAAYVSVWWFRQMDLSCSLS